MSYRQTDKQTLGNFSLFNRKNTLRLLKKQGLEFKMNTKVTSKRCGPSSLIPFLTRIDMEEVMFHSSHTHAHTHTHTHTRTHTRTHSCISHRRRYPCFNGGSKGRQTGGARL